MQSLILALVVICVSRCWSFKQVRRKSFQRIEDDNARLVARDSRHHRHMRKRLSSAKAVFSVRGGNHDCDDDEYGDETYDLISSFQSELAAIRRDVEMEASYELQKIRDLMEQSGSWVEGEDATTPLFSETTSEPNDNDGLSTAMDCDSALENDTIQDENDDVPPGTSDIEIERTDATIQEEYSEAFDQSDIENSEEVIDLSEKESASVEAPNDESAPLEDRYLQHEDLMTLAESNLYQSGIDVGDRKERQTATIDNNENHEQTSPESFAELNESSVLAVSHTEPMASGTFSVWDDEVSSDTVELKKAKKKRAKQVKSSKGSRKMKTTKNVMKGDGESLDRERVGSGKSVVLTYTENEIDHPSQKGILFYLKSDLGRALCLFLATLIIAILTKRLERQMEAEGTQ
ncbi:hypothetical protein ACHAWF_002202 [Thalassiosira exigua]